VITWDGLLDNGAELISECRDTLTPAATDVEIVAAIYDRWGTGCFAKLIGDWAVSIWSPNARSLVLAKDPIGTRHLYYTFDKNQVCWSTILDPLFLFGGKTFALEEEYIAGWLSFFPATHLTPYVGIHAVSPSSFVLIRSGKHTVSKYWDFDPSKRIRYRTDAEYEELFRCVFRESVRRRLRSDTPVLAELSGGMDSSSIVCMADTTLSQGSSEAPQLDTISYYDDFEPNWNERPYFEKVEDYRGRTGHHIAIDSTKLRLQYAKEQFPCTPSSGSQWPDDADQLTKIVRGHGYRVLLSGIGGDEILGGVPTPIPELADLVARGRLFAFASQTVAWALAKRKPLVQIAAQTLCQFLPSGLSGRQTHRRTHFWLEQSFVGRYKTALEGYATRLKVLASLPSFQENQNTVDLLRRQISCSDSLAPLCDQRYPYLDRDLLEFIYAIPCEQLLRPGHRRSLMRRALSRIVPAEILNRRRKAFVERGPRALISANWLGLLPVAQHSVMASMGIVNASAFVAALQAARAGKDVPIAPLMRTLRIEFWVRHLLELNYLKTSTVPADVRRSATRLCTESSVR
jgi:asparagine synthase (glutamine-hydrolysing)